MRGWGTIAWWLTLLAANLVPPRAFACGAFDYVLACNTHGDRGKSPWTWFNPTRSLSREGDHRREDSGHVDRTPVAMGRC
jgi:hypothetical protein